MEHTKEIIVDNILDRAKDAPIPFECTKEQLMEMDREYLDAMLMRITFMSIMYPKKGG